jgi:PPM family protein phosphatase
MSPSSVSSSRLQGATSLLEYSGDTTVGLRRDNNEDALAAFEDTNTFVVVDGCGGVSSGENAARLAIECFRQVLQEDGTSIDSPRVADPLAVAILRANAAVFREAHTKPELRGQGATLCAIRASEKRVTIAHVGDCRVGRFRDNVLAWLTEDHSLLVELRRNGAPADQIAYVEKNHSTILTRAVGVQERLAADVSYHPTTPGDIYLLCSDGLSEHVRSGRIGEILSTHASDLPAACAALLAASEAAGGEDNATVILLRVRA